MRVLSREVGADGKVEVEVLEEVAEGPTVESAVRKAREAEGLDGLGSGLIEFVDLPGMWQNNEFIVGGYRFIPIEDWPKLVRSLFAVHNETVNIHSHLGSSVLVLLSIPYFIYSTPFTSVTPPATFDTVVLLFFLLAAFKCLFCSATWHLFAGCATKRYFLTFACVDYLGISWLIAASVNSVVYFGFYQHPTPMAVYGALNLMVGVTGSILPFQRWFNQRHNKHLRILFFLGMAFSALAPIAHMMLLNSLPRTLMFLRPLAPSLSSYFFGLWFYANHYPESRWPGVSLTIFSLSLFAASHNIWHAAIVAAIAFHFRGVMELYKQKDIYSSASATIFRPGTFNWWEAVSVLG
ncbi:hemolysin-III related-domain-containing protein [Mrakia frigida]|uniref:hemolysin-III related-domain-containing protein n=1 Tax=Mrakia frigida TaxID=29902 RepID=UPI003FCC2734